MAATVIDALMVTLGIDAKGFLSGKNQATDATKKLSAEEVKAAKATEENNKRATESFKKVRNEVLALLAIFTAGMGLKDFTESTINSAVNLGYMAKNLQMSTQDLSAWQRAAERAGGSADGITAQLQQSQQAVAKFKIGQVGDDIVSFLRWGGKTSDLKDGNSYLLARSNIISKMFQVDPAKAQLVSKAMGVSDEEFNFIKQGATGVLALVAAQEKNSAISEKQSAQALKLKNEWLDFSDRLKYVGTTVLLELMPTFEILLQKLQGMADWVADHKADISKWVDGAVAAIREFVDEANKAADAVGGWKNVLIALAALKVLSIAAPLFQLAGALSGVGGGLAAIALSGPGALAALAGLSVAAELARKSALDRTIPAGPNHDQYVAEAQAGGAVTPNVTQPPSGGFGKLGQWLKHSFGTSEAGRQKQAMDYFLSQGWSSAQAAGIVGSLTQESDVDSESRNKKSGAYGIGQWLGSRVADFKKWSGHDLNGSSFEEQLGFMQYELTKGKEQAAGQRLRATKTAEEAAAVHAQSYERPGAAEANISNRQAYARLLYASLGQSNASQVAGQSSGARGAGASASRISQMTSSAETNINGPITIQTQATDAQGIAREFGKAVGKYSFTVPQANTGLT
jgi:hypothetical protein